MNELNTTMLISAYYSIIVLITLYSINPNTYVIIELKTKLLTNGMDIYMGTKKCYSLLYTQTLA